MYKRVLCALDLEGVNKVVGVPYEGLGVNTDGWRIAREEAVIEVNAAADALFAAGVDRVALWDNHGGGGNVDPFALDPRIELLKVDTKEPRMSFAEGEFDCICFFGYHAMEGTLGGVLAHTMNSRLNQYYKLNGRYIGEVDMDAYIAASHKMPSRFFAGGDIACRQAKGAVPDIVSVVTKRELGRNSAEFRDEEELLSEIREKIVSAVTSEGVIRELKLPARFEKSFKRMEDGAVYLERLRGAGISAEHPEDEILGRDAHTVSSEISSVSEFITCI